MAFKGTLKEFKVPDILQLISLQMKTGVLTFTSKDGFVSLIFEKGKIVGVDHFPKKLEMRVGNVLVRQDYISEEMLMRALSIQKRTNQKVGEILLSMGLIGENVIQEALKTQAVQISLSLFKWRKGEYNFKVMDYIDATIRTIDPIPTDNLIMEGVQMLDEWPLIKNLIPNEKLVFEPIPIESNKIEIVEEYDEEEELVTDKIFLTEAEASVLKFVNGENSIRDIVDVGKFTEYKVYKSIYKMIKKSLVRKKEEVDSKELDDEKLVEEFKLKSIDNINKLHKIIFIFLLLILFLSFFTPLNPLKDDNILWRKDLYKILTETETG